MKIRFSANSAIPLLLIIFLTGFMLFWMADFYQTSAVDPFDPPGITPTPAPTDWHDFLLKINHVAIEPVAPEKVPVRLIVLPDAQTAALMMPTMDGGCLAVSQVPVNKADSSANPANILRVTHFKADGSVLWDRQYTTDIFNGYPASLCVFSDDGFAIGLRVTKDGSQTSDILLRFSNDGAKSWQTTENQTPAGSLDYLFAAPDGVVLAAGMISDLNPDGSYGNKISLLRFEKEGRLSFKQDIGVNENWVLDDAAFSAETGLVLAWQKDAAGQPAAGDAYLRISQVGCYGTDLGEKWISEMKSGLNFYEVEALPDNQGVLAYGQRYVPATLNNPAVSCSAIAYLNGQGAIDWQYWAEETGTWMGKAARIADGRFIASQYSSGTNSESTTLLLFPASGLSPQTLGKLPGLIQQLILTKDGGFTVVLRQSVQTIPQPPFVSSIWVDSEAIVAHYDRDFNLVWRRTIDRYKNVLRSDIIVATVDDRLLVG